ncbi:MAG: hypothetical protein OXM61_10000 [Candidatus Poribacteria bacterium]|nr:hypothetical protein [Candidatus Poribacteria bacterium]
MDISAPAVRKVYRTHKTTHESTSGAKGVSQHTDIYLSPRWGSTNCLHRFLYTFRTAGAAVLQINTFSAYSTH